MKNWIKRNDLSWLMLAEFGIAILMLSTILIRMIINI